MFEQPVGVTESGKPELENKGVAWPAYAAQERSVNTRQA